MRLLTELRAIMEERGWMEEYSARTSDKVFTIWWKDGSRCVTLTHGDQEVEVFELFDRCEIQE
jgi:hypothetical protein